VHSEAHGGDRGVQLVVDRDRAAEVGLASRDVVRTVAAALRGDKLRELRSGVRELEMRLAFRPDDRQRIGDLARLLIPRPGGGHLPLGAIARLHEVPGERAIERVNRLTSVVVTGTLARGTTLDDVRKRVPPVLESFPSPPGCSRKFGRGFDENDETLATMMQNTALAIVLIFLLMAALFESLLYPPAIVTSIGFAVIAVFWLFAANQMPVTLMAMVGIMILVDVVVNIGTVLIAHVANLRAQGLARNVAILRAGRDRLRPILMTTATTLLGLVPLAIGDARVGGGGRPAYYPMARDLRRTRVRGAGVAVLRARVLRPVLMPPRRSACSLPRAGEVPGFGARSDAMARSRSRTGHTSPQPGCSSRR